MGMTSDKRGEFEEYSWTECPHCVTRLRVEHELWPRFYAFEEES